MCSVMGIIPHVVLWASYYVWCCRHHTACGVVGIVLHGVVGVALCSVVGIALCGVAGVVPHGATGVAPHVVLRSWSLYCGVVVMVAVIMLHCVMVTVVALCGATVAITIVAVVVVRG